MLHSLSLFDAVLVAALSQIEVCHEGRRMWPLEGAVVVASLVIAWALSTTNRLDVRIDPTTSTLIYVVDRSNGSISICGSRRPDTLGASGCTRIYTSQ